MEPGDELRFRLRQVERRTVGFRNRGEEKDHEGEWLGEDEPVGQGQGERADHENQVLRLLLHDGANAERRRQQEDAHQRQAEHDLVGDDLGRGAETAEE